MINKVITLTASLISLIFIFGILVANINTAYAQAAGVTVKVIGTGAPRTVAVINDCLASGGSITQCADAALNYLDNVCGTACYNNKIVSGCSNNSCTITCGNGSTIIITKPEPSPTPTPTPTTPPDYTCTLTSTRQCQQNNCVPGWIPNPDTSKTCNNPAVCCIKKPPATNTPRPTTPVSTPRATSTPVATPTDGPSCNSPCSLPADCNGAQNGCTYCEPTTNTCQRQPTPTPTTPVTCNSPCSLPADCNGAQNGCTYCEPTTNTCQVEPTATPVPTATTVPTNTPVPTPTPDVTGMCKCDDLKVAQIVLGQPIEIEAFAKVEGEDVTKAEVTGMKFRIFEGNASAGRVRELPEKGDVPVTIVDESPSLVRYKAEWSANPTIVMGEEYRIIATPNCSVKTAFIQRQLQRVVLAERDENVGFFGQIRNFLAGLFGGGSEVDEGVSIEQEKTNPFSFITDFFAPQSVKRDKLQLDTFTPAQMDREACNIMMFKFDFTSP